MKNQIIEKSRAPNQYIQLNNSRKYLSAFLRQWLLDRIRSFLYLDAIQPVRLFCQAYRTFSAIPS